MMKNLSANHPQPGTVGVAMSGGVDSSVSALLLQKQGMDLAGLFMKNWEEDDRHGACTAEADAADAQAVADALGITLHRRNFAAEYWDYVFEDFLTEYRAGRTPNPDILCNREIKFKTFIDHATDLGAEYIATGHYVRGDCRDGIHRLLKGLDPNKDQSYFLHAVSAEALSETLFPLGDLLKADVRRIARDHVSTDRRRCIEATDRPAASRPRRPREGGPADAGGGRGAGGREAGRRRHRRGHARGREGRNAAEIPAGRYPDRPLRCSGCPWENAYCSCRGDVIAGLRSSGRPGSSGG